MDDTKKTKAQLIAELEELRQRYSRDEYNAIINTTSDGYWKLDRTGRFVDVNDKYCVMSGYSRKELLGMRISDVDVIESPEVTKAYIEKIMKDSLDRFETKHRRKNGSIYDVEISTVFLKDLNQFVAFVHDITERKNAEEALIERESKLRALFEYAQYAIGISIEGYHVKVNTAYLELFGYEKEEELTNAPIIELIAHDDRKKIIENIKLRAEGKQIPTTYETRGLRKDGTEFDMDVNISIYELDGKKYSVCFIQDVTERKNAEKLYIAEKTFTETAVNAQLDTFFAFDPVTGKPLRWNKIFAEISGYSDEEISSMKAPNDFYSEEDLNKAAEAMKTLMKEGKAVTELNLITKNGHTIPYEYVVSLIENQKDRDLIISVGRDITDRKKLDEALLTSKKLLSETQTIANVGSWEWNLKTGKSTLSEQYYNIFGRDIKQGIPSLESYWESSHPDDRKRVRKTIETAIEENKPYKIEYRFYRESDGEERWLRSECIFEEDANGHPNRLLGFAQDITESKKAEEALRVSEQRFKGAFDYAAIGLALVSPEGRFIKVNKSLCELLGYDKKELLSLTFQEITHPDDLEKDIEFVNQLLEDTIKFYFMEKRYFHKNGCIVWTQLSVSLVRDNNGLPVHFVSQIQDITERKKAEEALQKSEDLLNATGLMAQVGGWEIDLLGDTLAWTEETFRIHELSIDTQPDVSGAINFYHPDDRERVASAVEQAVANGLPFDFEARLITKLGNQIWVRATGQRILQKGKITGVRGCIQNITERKNAEENIISLSKFPSEDPNPVLRIDGDCKILYRNEAVDKLLQKVNLSLKQIYKILPKNIKSLINRALETGEAMSYLEVPVDSRTYSYSLVPIVESQYVNLYGRDITERIESAKKLMESEEKYKSLYANALVAIFRVSLIDQKIILANQATANLFGYTSIDELIEEFRSINHYANPEDRESFIQELRDKGTVDKILMKSKKKDGTVFWNEASFHLNSQDGFIECVSFDVTGREIAITKRKNAEIELKTERDYSKNLIDTAQTIVLQLDTDGMIVFFNSYMENLSGYTLDEVKGKDWFTTYLPECDQDKIRSLFNKAIGNIQTKGIITPIVTKDGVEKQIEWIDKTLRNNSGEIIGLLSIGLDITERKQLEEERLKSSKLESIGVLAGGIAHDFNNILAAILGNTSLAKITIDNKEELIELLTETEKATVRATKLTQQLLTFAKGGAPVKEVSELAELIIDTAGFSLRGSNVKYHAAIDPELWTAEVDKGQIGQVIGNLVINAKQAMPNGGTINIKAENIEVASNDNLPLSEGNYIRISVTDKGHGISAEQLTKIFDPYFTTKQMGSGLGLATVYSIIHRHDGHIAVKSKVGTGTIFTLYLPASSKQIAGIVTGNENSAVLTGKILIMDDEEMIRNFVSKALKSFGNDVDEARDGAEAIKKYKKAMDSGKPFDAVIMDLTIPAGMGGQEAIKKLLEIAPEAKAIVSSGYANDPVISNFEAYGFKGYIPKPYRLDELKKVLNEVMSGK